MYSAFQCIPVSSATRLGHPAEQRRRLVRHRDWAFAHQHWKFNCLQQRRIVGHLCTDIVLHHQHLVHVC